jgi:hypothetical protein
VTAGRLGRRHLTSCVIVGGLALATPARAQHEHHHHVVAPDAPPTVDAPPPPRPFTVGLRLVAGRYDQALYIGDYTGLELDLAWTRGRVTLRASLPGYHLRKNGASRDGVGDLALGVDAVVVERGALMAGASLGATVPTGDMMTGLGMGHPMWMPMVWASRAGARSSFGVSAGWGGTLGADAAHHDHGAWPIVAPMTSSELMADVHGEAALGHRLAALARVEAAVPLDGGATRAVAGLGAAWRGGRSETSAELQAGLAGDPFTVRALVRSALRF